MRPAWALLLAVCVGCAHGPRAPAITGWHELRSAHFRLRTNLTVEDARTTIRRLETLRAALGASWPDPLETPGTTDAIVLHDPAELRTYSSWVGLATTTRRGPLLVTAGVDVPFGDGSPDVAVLAHEVAHDVNRWRMPVVPRWFDEGLAAYLETVELVGDNGVRYGAARPELISAARTEGVLPLDALERLSWETASAEEVQGYYRSARLWIHVLRAEEPRRMRALESSLAAGVPWTTAWPRAGEGLDEARLADTLHRWLVVGSLPTEFRRYPPPTLASIEERPLAAWEVHLVLAELWQVGAGPPDAGERAARRRTELDAARRLAPHEPLPQVLLADLEPDPVARRAAAQGLVTRYPRSPEAAVLLARIERDEGGPPEGREEAVRLAVSLAPDDVDALTAFALEAARLGRYTPALETARRAVAFAPWNPTVFTTLAEVLARVEHCPEALATFQRAIDVLPDRVSRDDLAALLRERSRMESSCTAGR